MAKKRASPKQPQLSDGNGPIGDLVPKKVQDAVDAYVEAMREQSDALENKNRLYDEAMSAMRKHGITKVRIPDKDGNFTKMIELEDEPKLKIKKLNEAVTVGGGESGE
jgi:hypothetical protein